MADPGSAPDERLRVRGGVRRGRPDTPGQIHHLHATVATSTCDVLRSIAKAKQYSLGQVIDALVHSYMKRSEKRADRSVQTKEKPLGKEIRSAEELYNGGVASYSHDAAFGPACNTWSTLASKQQTQP